MPWSIPALKPSIETPNPATRTFGMFALLLRTFMPRLRNHYAVKEIAQMAAMGGFR